jgi:hypothetical protein
MKRILSVLGLLLLVSCTTSAGEKTQMEKDSLAKLKTFEDSMVEITAQQTVGRDVTLEVVERGFFDNFLLAVVHFHFVEKPSEANPQPMSGHIFFILGRMKATDEWVPMNNFSRLDALPSAPSGGEGEKL